MGFLFVQNIPQTKTKYTCTDTHMIYTHTHPTPHTHRVTFSVTIKKKILVQI